MRCVHRQISMGAFDLGMVVARAHALATLVGRIGAELEMEIQILDFRIGLNGVARLIAGPS